MEYLMAECFIEGYLAACGDAGITDPDKEKIIDGVFTCLGRDRNEGMPDGTKDHEILKMLEKYVNNDSD